jgi:hypothetical protein
MTEAIQNASSGEFMLAAIVTAVLIAAALYLFQRSLRHARLMEDLPTSRIRSAAQGYVELEGRGKMMAGEPILSPLSCTPCLWWEYRITERQHNNDRNTPRVRTIDSGRSDALFLLNDFTGECIIDPDGAEIRPNTRHKWHGSTRWPKAGPTHSIFSFFAKYCYEERLILPGTPLYTIGYFRTQRTVVGHFDEQTELNELMREWKQDQALLHQRFDINKDGRIDATEWEAARRVALKQVRRDLIEQDMPSGLHVLSRPNDRRPFLISTTPQAQLITRYRMLTFTSVVSFLGLIAALVWAIGIRH